MHHGLLCWQWLWNSLLTQPTPPFRCLPQHFKTQHFRRSVRDDFPILHQTINGKQLLYFDSASTSQKPRCVMDVMDDFYLNHNSGVHRGVHQLSAQATVAYSEARSKVAAFIDAASDSEVVWTRNATEAINLVANTWGVTNLKQGDEVQRGGGAVARAGKVCADVLFRGTAGFSERQVHVFQCDLAFVCAGDSVGCGAPQQLGALAAAGTAARHCAEVCEAEARQHRAGHEGEALVSVQAVTACC